MWEIDYTTLKGKKKQAFDTINAIIIVSIWMFPKIGVPRNGCFRMENLIKMDDLGVPLFLETPISLKSRLSMFVCVLHYSQRLPLRIFFVKTAPYC